MNILNQHVIEEDNKCCGKNCPNTGSILLKIKYINKMGYFCDFCSERLLDEGLAIRSEDDSSMERVGYVND